MVDAARSGRTAGGVFQFLLHRLDQHRVLADAQRAKLVDRVRQAAGQSATEIGNPDASRPASVATRSVTIGRLPLGFSAAPAKGSSAGSSTIWVRAAVIFMALPQAGWRRVGG